MTLTTAEMPSHSHRAAGQSGAGSSSRPAGRVPAVHANAYSALAPDRLLSGAFVQGAGGDHPDHNMPPHLGINFIIALYGIFPSP